MDRVGKRSENRCDYEKKVNLSRHIGIGHGHVFSLQKG